MARRIGPRHSPKRHLGAPKPARRRSGLTDIFARMPTRSLADAPFISRFGKKACARAVRLRRFETVIIFGAWR
jgi:hypothetical protein